VNEVLYEVTEHVARVTINRPHVLNAIDQTTERILQDIWNQIEHDRDVWVVVLTGAGDRAFSVGADMTPQQEFDLSGLEYWATDRPGGFGGIALRRTLDVPIIAAVNGYALGGGMEMVLGCDVVVAAQEAQFGLTEPRVGRIPLDGGVFQLVRQLPLKHAMALLLTGRRISAHEALEFALVNEVVPRASLGDAVQRWVDDVLACAPLSLRAIKQMVNGSQFLPPHEASRLRFPALMEALQAEDAHEGVRAFQEKRSPCWQGR
jgi:enoyl-CoA hydratase/carnithine racemase